MRRIGLVGLGLVLALGACDFIQPSQPEDPSGRLAAECADQRRDGAEREAACSQLLDLADIDQTVRAEALAHRGEVRRDGGQPTQALADFNAALAIAPEQSGAQLGKAAILIESGQLQAAEPMVEAVIERGELLGQAHLIRGNLRLRWGDVSRAVQDYDAAIAADSRLADAYAQRGSAKQGYEEFGQAREDFDRAINIESENAVARAGRCWNRLLQDQGAGDARNDAEVAVRAAPEMFSAQTCLGMAALKVEDYPVALAAYEAAVAIEPGNAEALYGRGVARIRNGQRREGNDDVDQAQRFNSRADARFRALDVEL
jgi:tetratricopeptide (TPR) repeat protein